MPLEHVILAVYHRDRHSDQLMSCVPFVGMVNIIPYVLRYMAGAVLLTLMLMAVNLTKTKLCKKTENDRNPGIWVLI